jgi:ComF family protein
MSLLDLLFPKSCLECGKYGIYICPECLSKVPLAKNVCLGCFRPSVDGKTHFKCRKKLLADCLFSLWKYQGVVRKAILKLKYKFAYDIADELARKFISGLGGEVLLPSSAVLIPVPLHRLRENWRGFNQAENIGEIISQKMGWKFQPNVLQRYKFTKTQVGLKRKQRLANVRGVFRVVPKEAFNLDRKENIVIFDDVFTTGSTIKEAGKVFKRLGFEDVWTLTLAR